MLTYIMTDHMFLLPGFFFTLLLHTIVKTCWCEHRTTYGGSHFTPELARGALIYNTKVTIGISGGTISDKEGWSMEPGRF